MQHLVCLNFKKHICYFFKRSDFFKFKIFIFKILTLGNKNKETTVN